MERQKIGRLPFYRLQVYEIRTIADDLNDRVRAPGSAADRGGAEGAQDAEAEGAEGAQRLLLQIPRGRVLVRTERLPGAPNRRAKEPER